MADIQSNINVNINTSEALASIRTLQRQISAFYESMARSGAAANAAVSGMQNNLINTINQTGKFSASIKNIASTTESFTTALEKNKLSMGQYFKFAGGASKTFGKFFKTEMDTIDKVARERVKTLQTQYIKLGRDASGALKSIAVRPLALDMEDLGTKTAIAAQKQQLMNQVLKQGSTNLLNFGKNTQWAGRQLMVGFTIPLSMVGTAAAKTFMKMEEQAIKFKRVYGDSMTPTAETDAMVKQIRDLASEFTKYGVAAEKTMELAATAAAAGKQGADLTAQVREANRLAVLGQVEQQDALNTTISITNAFGVAADELAKKIDFLNAVENQTVTSIEDLTVAVPKAGPVVQQLGGDVEDLTFFLTAMKEGGINASEGANALKSGLAALINPTGKAADMLAGFGINVKNIVESNKGDVKGLVLDFASALDTLDPLSRARAIEQMFGKFQFSRLSTLFQNVIKDGSQASRVLDLTSESSAELAALASKELGTVAASSMFKFQKSVEDLKVAIAPIGEIFLKLVTPVIEFGTKILENFNKLDAGAKNFILGLTVVLGGIGPVLLMTFGLLANGIANIVKGFMLVRNIFNKSGQSSKFLGDQTDYMTQQQLEATGVAASLEQVHQRLEQRFTSEATAVDKLTQALQRANNANLTFQGRNAGAAGAKPKKYAKGVVSVPGPKGAGDIIPAMLAPGEAVVPAKQAVKYGALIKGIVADNIPGYEDSNVDTTGSKSFKTYTDFTALLSKRANSDLNTRQASPTEIARQFSQNPVDIQGPLLVALAEELGGAKTQSQIDKFFQTNPQVLDYGRQLSLGIAEEVSSITAKTMGDTDLYKAVDTARKKIKTSPEIQRASDLIATRATTYEEDTVQRQRGSGRLMQMGRERLTNLRGRFTTVANRGLAFARRRGAQLEDPVAAHLTGPRNLSIEQARTLDLSKQANEALQRKINEIQTIRVGGKSVDVPETATVEQRRAAMRGAGMTVVSDSVSAAIVEGSKVGAKKAAGLTPIAIEQGVNEAIQRNSPPKRAIQIGRDYGFALNGALRESIPKVRVSGAAFGLAATASMTTISPANMQHLRETAGRIVRPYLDAQGTLIPIMQQRVQILEKEAVAARAAAVAQSANLVALQQTATMGFIGPLQQSLLSDRPGKKNKKNQKNEDGDSQPGSKMAGVTNTIRNLSFGLTSLAAAGTMAGGSVGAVSNAIMQFSGVSYALLTVMDLLSMASGKAKAGILAQIGSFLMFSKGGAAKAAGGLGFLATMKNAFLPISNAFKTAAPGIKGFFGAIRTVVPLLFGLVRGLLSFIPVIGIVAAGITGLVLIVNAVNEAKERERLATEGVADAMINTKKELDAVANALGKKRVVTAVETIGTAGIGQEAAAQIGTVETLRSDQSFLDEYRADIKQMETMSQRELKSYQDNLAIRLQAEGQYTKEEIQGVITALQQEAKRTDVRLDFASIDMTSKDPKQFQKVVDRFAANAKDSGSSTLTQAQATEAGNIAMAGYYETLMSTSTALMTGVVNLEQYNSRVAALKTSLDSLGEAAKTKIVDGMLKRFVESLPESAQEFGKLAGSVQGSNNQLFVMEALTSKSITEIGKLKEVIEALGTVASGVGGNVTQAQFDAAQKVVNSVKKDIATANKETADFVKGQTTTGSGQKSVFQQASEDLFNNIKSIKEASKAYGLLSKAGFSAADAFTLAQNPALATALATTKVGTEKWKKLVSLAKEFVSVTKAKTLSDTLANLSGQAVRLTKFEKLSKYLTQMGLSSEEVSSVLQDEALADSLIDATEKGKKGFEEIDKFVSSKLSNIELRIKIFPEEYVKEGIQKAMDAFNAEENVLNIKFRIKTKADQDLIREKQAIISGLNFQADDYEAGLTRLEDGESAINEKYDNRLEALDKIIAANDRIADQNKEELNIFQMVARGDIAGAAAGIAQLQQQKAKNALEAKKESLQAQRTNELELLTAEVVVNGQRTRMTRNQIEENLKSIKQQIFDIEENSIEPAQNRIDLAQQELDKQTASQTILGKTKDEWDFIGGEIDLAKTKTTTYIGELQRALDVAKDLQATLAGGGTVVKPEDFTEKKKVETNKNPAVGGPGGPGSPATTKTTEQRREDSSANRNTSSGEFKSDAIKDPTYSEVASYQNDLSRVRLYEAGRGFTMTGENYDTSKKNVKDFESLYNKRDRASGEYWSSPTLKATMAKKAGYFSSGGMVMPKKYAMGGMVMPSPEPPPKMLAMGGMVMPKKFAAGGFAMGTDTVPAMLTPGEFVVSKYGVDNYGVDNLKAINNGTAGANSVYNGYNINVNVKSNSNPDQIANAVMTQIRQVNSQQVRGNRL